MRALSTRGNALASMTVADLFRLRTRLGTFGLSRETLTVEMAMRLVMPFAYLAACLFAVSLGWAFRPRGGARVTAGSAVLVPLVPAVLAVLTLLYVHAQRVVAGFAVLAFGLPVALVVLGIVQLAVLAGALVLLAGQSTR